MYSKNIDVSAALEIIRNVRPSVQYVYHITFACRMCSVDSRPNDGFLIQLEIFHQASYKVSRRDKETRMFYLERAVEDILSAQFFAD